MVQPKQKRQAKIASKSAGRGVDRIVVGGENFSEGIKVEQRAVPPEIGDALLEWWELQAKIRARDPKAHGNGFRIYPQRAKLQVKISNFDGGVLVPSTSGFGSYYTFNHKGERQPHVVDPLATVPEEGDLLLGYVRDFLGLENSTSVIVNEYGDGHYIPWHTDNNVYVGDVVVLTFLLQEGDGGIPTLDFRHPSAPKQVQRVPLADSSVCTMTGSARTVLEHSLTNTHGTRRVSFTFRSDVNEQTVAQAPQNAWTSLQAQQTCRVGNPQEQAASLKIKEDLQAIHLSRPASLPEGEASAGKGAKLLGQSPDMVLSELINPDLTARVHVREQAEKKAEKKAAPRRYSATIHYALHTVVTAHHLEGIQYYYTPCTAHCSNGTPPGRYTVLLYTMHCTL
jgi:alkylated DNA repair dioxygenase AlkB